MSYKEQIDLLAEIESFDANAFIEDDNCPKFVCDFILALAVIYNDIRDVIFLRVLLAEQNPAGEEITKERGQFNALDNSLMRLQAGILSELLALIYSSDKAIENDVFQKLFGQLSREGHEAWITLVKVANGRDVNDQLGKALIFMRNKVAFHYDAKIISNGYRNCFKSDDGRQPLLSRGTRMRETRFFFADAATQNYMKYMGEIDGAWDAALGNSRILQDINQSLYELVTKFPILRGYAWRRFKRS